MSPELRSLLVFAAAAIAVWFLTPLAIRIAIRSRLLDIPAGYKGHARATPYLGGAAILAGLLVAAEGLGGSLRGEWPLLGFAVVLWAVGTLDDSRNLPVTLRVAVEVGIAVALWALNDGWKIFGSELLNLPLTVVWVVGVVNAFNLMDNMDGAAATTAGLSALGAGALSLVAGSGALAPLCFAVAGACIGFLPYNLARPARIFMGDGGSLPIGLLVAALTILVVRSSYGYLGPTGVIVGGLLVGLVILDTSLVTFSRTRGRRPVFSGGRDHLTHRVVERLGSPRAVAGALAVTQLAVCLVAIAVARAGVGWVLLAGGTVLILGAVLIWQFERVWSSRLTQVSPKHGVGVATAVPPEAAEPSRGHSQPEAQPGRALA